MVGKAQRLLRQWAARLHMLDARLPYLVCCLALGLLFVLVYVPHAGALGLYNDDWTHIRWVRDISLAAFTQIPMDFRPFELLPWLPALYLYWPHLTIAYLLLILVDYMVACLLCMLTARWTRSRLLALVVAGLWALFPANMAQFWLTGGYYQLGVCFALLALVILSSQQLPSRPRMALALVCALLCLCCNELFVGSMLVVAFVAAGAAPENGVPARLRSALPFSLLTATYLVYRLWLGPRVLHLPDMKAASTGASVPQLLNVLDRGFAVLFVTAWMGPIAAIGHGLSQLFTVSTTDERLLLMGSADRTPGDLTVATAIVCFLLIAVTLALLSWLGRSRQPARWALIKPGVMAGCLGAIQVVAGYASLANTGANQGPTTAGIGTRINAAAMPGAAMAIAGALWVLAFWLPLHPRAGKVVFMSAAVFAGILGLVQFERTTAMYTVAWSEEQKMWHAVLRTVPGLQPHSFVLLTGADAASADVIAAQQPWGIDDAFGLFYPEADIHADLLVPASIPSACPPPGERPVREFPYFMQLLPGGLISNRSTEAFGSRILVLRYDRSGAGRVTVVAPVLSVANGRCIIPSNPALILHTSTTLPQYRWLASGLARLLG